MAIERRALVLNQNYEPLNVCAVRRAFVLVYHGKAEVIEAVERTDGLGFAAGLQWHNELQWQHDERFLRPFLRVVAEG